MLDGVGINIRLNQVALKQTIFVFLEKNGINDITSCKNQLNTKDLRKYIEVIKLSWQLSFTYLFIIIN
jgi:hypothetical protein